MKRGLRFVLLGLGAATLATAVRYTVFFDPDAYLKQRHEAFLSSVFDGTYKLNRAGQRTLLRKDRVAVRLLEDGAIRHLDCARHLAASLRYRDLRLDLSIEKRLLEGTLESLYRERARDVAARVAPHAIGHCKNRVLGEDEHAVLVLPAYSGAIGLRLRADEDPRDGGGHFVEFDFVFVADRNGGPLRHFLLGGDRRARRRGIRVRRDGHQCDFELVRSSTKLNTGRISGSRGGAGVDERVAP